MFVCSCSCSYTLFVCLLSNNFHISLILKGQKLFGSQKWADGGWLNMHLIPFGLVSVSKPPTFLSHNHSYRFSNQFRLQPGLRWLVINSCQLSWLKKKKKKKIVASEGCLVNKQPSPVADRGNPTMLFWSSAVFHSFYLNQHLPELQYIWQMLSSAVSALPCLLAYCQVFMWNHLIKVYHG